MGGIYWGSHLLVAAAHRVVKLQHPSIPHRLFAKVNVFDHSACVLVKKCHIRGLLSAASIRVHEGADSLLPLGFLGKGFGYESLCYLGGVSP